MPLLKDIKGMFRSRPPKGRKRDAAPMEDTDFVVAESQAAGLAAAAAEAGEDSGVGDEPPVIEARASTAGFAAIEPKVESRSARRFSGVGGKNASEEVFGLITKIGDHLEKQSARTEKLMGLLDRMPAALDSMPEISRQNARLLETLTDHLAQQKQREAAVNEALACLGAATSRQTDVLGLIQQQLDAGTVHTERLTNTLGEFRGCLEDLSRSNKQSAEVLSEIARQSEEREQSLLKTINRSQVWMIAALVGCGIAALSALGIALAAIVG